MSLVHELDRDSLIRVLCLCSAQDVLALSCTCRELRDLLKDDLLWQRLAEQKWGLHVRELAQVEQGGWAAWTRHRLSTRSRTAVSPLDLVQEHYHDAFQHMVSCVLCSRTSGGPMVRQAIYLFLELWPTPSALLDASEERLLEVMHPLGLPAQRLVAVRSLAHGFLATCWQDPHEFKGCGKFVSDSWRIFCRGQRSLAGVEDKNLQRYVRWAQSGTLDDKQQRGQGPPASAAARKRKAETPAEPGILRSGRRRGSPAASSSGGGNRAGQDPAAASAGERRVTRASAAAAAASGSPAGATKGRAGQQRRSRERVPIQTAGGGRAGKAARAVRA